MRTLSARILLGFAALTVTFGVITATLVVNMRQVEREVLLIGGGYVPLALDLKDLFRYQEDVRSYLGGDTVKGGEDMMEAQSVQIAQYRLKSNRKQRDKALAATRITFEGLDGLADVDPKHFAITRPKIEALQATVLETEPLYDLVVANPPIKVERPFDLKHAAAYEALEKLRILEQKLVGRVNDLSLQLDTRVQNTTHDLENNEKTLWVRTIYLGVAAVLLGLITTIWVVITLRPLRRLRDAARRVAAGDYGSRIVERGPAEVVDLAREFNAMGRAVEERERELVRSERLAAVGTMAAMITHEVRNPLSSIGLNTELLEDELGPDAEEARNLCNAITHEVDRLTAITEEYLLFARLPKPKIQPEPINPMVSSLAAFVRKDLAAKQVELATELGEGDLTALVDASQMRQCLINLVRNAADAVTTKGGGHVTLRTRRLGARIAIQVADDGVGIAPDVLPRLFDPFFSTKEGGSGLGLALTKQIVKDHGGDLKVESVVGRGTTFTVSVPAYVPA
jgi:two-component system NtrC family sensor kinase